MTKARAGLVLLTIWCGLNALVALGVTAMTLAGRSPPALALVMSRAEAQAIDPRALGVIQAQAAIANPCIIAVCAFALFLAWTQVAAGSRRAWGALAGILAMVQAAGYASDAFIGHTNLVPNLISTALLALALGLAATGTRDQQA